MENRSFLAPIYYNKIYDGKKILHIPNFGISIKYDQFVVVLSAFVAVVSAFLFISHVKNN